MQVPEMLARRPALLDIKPEVRPKILKHNAVRVLGLGS
jgi:predicted TIM-barrel fold metal-dependent hydrolase